MKKSVENLFEDKKSFNEKINKRLERIQNRCKHLNIDADRATMWHEWPDYGTDPGVKQCIDCLKIVGKNYESESYKIRNGKLIT